MDGPDGYLTSLESVLDRMRKASGSPATSVAEALRLVHAFLRIQNVEGRQAVIDLAEKLAQN